MTVPRPNRSLIERILYQLRTGTTGTVRGYGINASPSLTRDRILAARRGAAATPVGGRGSKIDTFDTITDDTVSSFSLTYRPIANSWNVSLNGVTQVDGVDYEITGRTLNVLDPEDLFWGADTQGTPWTLQVQYDYLAGVPAAPVTQATFPQGSDAGEQVGGNPEVEFDVAPAAGSSVLLAYRSKFGGLPSFVSGLGASWTAISSASGTALWLGTGCNGTDTLITTDNDCFWIGIVEVTTALTATGAQTVDSTNGNEMDLTATVAGVAVSLDRAGSGLANDPAAGLWTQMGNGSGGGATLRALVYAAGTGEEVGMNTNGVDDWDYGLLAVVRYA